MKAKSLQLLNVLLEAIVLEMAIPSGLVTISLELSTSTKVASMWFVAGYLIVMPILAGIHKRGLGIGIAILAWILALTPSLGILWILSTYTELMFTVAAILTLMLALSHRIDALLCQHKQYKQYSFTNTGL